MERDSVHSVEGDGSITDSGRGPSEEGGEGRTTTVPPRDRYLPPPPPPPRGGAYWAQQQPLLQPSHRTHIPKTHPHPTVRFHGLSTMPEEDADDGGDGSSKLSPGRQLGRRSVGGRAGIGRPTHTSSRSLQRSIGQYTVTADDPPTTSDDQHSLLQNGFVRDRERIYHDNSVIV